MSKDNPAPGLDSPGITQAQLEAAIKMAATEGHKAGITAERARIVAILGLDAAKDRAKQAVTIATTTDLSADQAKALLEASPAEAAKPATPAPKDRQQPASTIDPAVQPESTTSLWGKVTKKINAGLPGARQ